MAPRLFFTRARLVGFLLGLVTLSLFAPTLSDGFLVYDDQQYVTENPHVLAGFNLAGIRWAFGSFYASNWHPLTWVSHMADCQLYGLKSTGHHLTSILLHVANTLLLFSLLNHTTKRVWRSAAVAALFAGHPLHVESVAWISERKDLLCTFFFLLTMWAYARYTQEKTLNGKSAGGPAHSKTLARDLHNSGDPKALATTLWYVQAIVFFILALMSKPMAVTLPFVLLLMDVWPLKRIAGRPIRNISAEKIPFILLAVASCWVTLVAQRHAIVSAGSLSMGEKVSHATLAYGHYLSATVCPRNLAIYYPYARQIAVVSICASVAGLAAITLMCLWFFRRAPYLLVGWLWFMGMLVPVIGLVQAGDQAWADRYTYLPLIGLFIMVAWGASDLLAWLRVRIPYLQRVSPLALPAITAGAVGGMLILLTVRQLGFWKDSKTLFAHAAEVTQRNGRALVVVGGLLAQEGKADEAMRLYAQALSYDPRDPEAHFYTGNIFAERGELERAISEYEQSVWFTPLKERAHIAIGMALAKQHKYQAAAEHYRQAVKINPESAVAENNLAKVLHLNGDLDGAAQHYQVAIRLNPALAAAHNNLGVIHLQKGDAVESAAELKIALKLHPDDPETEANLARSLNRLGRWDEATNYFSRVEQQMSRNPEFHYEYATALWRLHRDRASASQFAKAVLLRQDYPEALDGLAWLLTTTPEATLRNNEEAVRIAEHACRLTGYKNPAYLVTLFGAYEEAGRTNDAQAILGNARNLANWESDPEAVEKRKVLKLRP